MNEFTPRRLTSSRDQVVAKPPRTDEGILKTAGILGRDPEDEEILNDLHALRKSSNHREIEESLSYRRRRTEEPMNISSQADPTLVRGVIHGKTIELESPLDLRDGETVEVQVRVISKSPRSLEGILKASGAFANNPNVEADFEIIERERKAFFPRDIEE
jgi:hypothetical protein